MLLLHLNHFATWSLSSINAGADALISKHNNLQRTITRLEQIDSHQAFVLLKSSLFNPKLQCMLRSSTAYQYNECLDRFDLVLRNVVTRASNVPLDYRSCTEPRYQSVMEGFRKAYSSDVNIVTDTASQVDCLHTLISLLDYFKNLDHFIIHTFQITKIGLLS